MMISRCRNILQPGRLGLRAFTLAEVLAALALMAIVIPVAIEGTAVANRAGQLGLRKAAASRVAQRILHESIVSGDATNLGSQGNIQEGNADYTWEITRTPWEIDDMDEVNVIVTFQVQGQTFDIELSTLIDPAAETATTAESLASL
jgi:prepilin-type N-terminal cleavage/methylation domain-containing protein